MVFKRTDGALDPDIRRLPDSQCVTGKYLVIKNGKIESTADSFVNAEIKAHAIVRVHPGIRVVVAQASLEVVGVPHVYEVQAK